MNNQNDDCDSLNGSPDPCWEYYLLWHRIKRVQAQIERGLMAISVAETMDHQIELQTVHLLIPAFNDLKQIIVELHPDPHPNRPA